MPYTVTGPFVVDAAYTLWQHYWTRSCNFPGPHQRGVDLYVVWGVTTSEATSDLRVYRSADGGLTWTAQDIPAMPIFFHQAGVSSERLDANTLRLGFQDQVLSVPVLRDFDLVTNTLGPIVVDCLPFIFRAPILAGYHRSTVAAEDRIFAMTSSFGLDRDLRLYRHDGVGFLPEIIVSDNVAAPLTKVCALEAFFMDALGTSHVIYSEAPIVAQKPRILYYRQIDAAGVMTAPVTVYTYQFQSLQTFGFPALAGNLLVFPFPLENGTSEADMYFTGSMLVVDPYTSPSPTITQIAIPTQRLNLPTSCNSGTINAATLGTTAYLWWVEEQSLDGMTPLSRILFSSYSGSGPPPAGTVWHNELTNPSFDPPGQPMIYLSPALMDFVDPVIFIGMSGAIGGIPFGPGAFVWVGVPAGAVPIVVPQYGDRKLLILVPNKWDRCLAKDACLHEAVNPQSPCCDPILYHDISWVRAPKNYTPFRKVGAVPTPLAVSGDVEVLAFDVPTGYDGIIAGVFNVYRGPGFLEGAGDLIWRLFINRVYAKHMGQVLVTLGSLQQPYPFEGGVNIVSGQRIRYIINAPNLSGGILPLNSQIVCGVEGLFYARQ